MNKTKVYPIKVELTLSKSVELWPESIRISDGGHCYISASKQKAIAAQHSIHFHRFPQNGITVEDLSIVSLWGNASDLDGCALVLQHRENFKHFLIDKPQPTVAKEI